MVARKQPSARSSVKAEANSPSAAQSAAARRVAEGQVRALIDKFAPEHLRLIGAARRALQKRLPTAHEIVYEYNGFFVISYSPSERGYEGVLALRASADVVRLYFNRGKELPDPGKILRGAAGVQARSIDLQGASTLARPEVVNLIEAAIALNSLPFARDGRGSIIMRTASTKKRSKARPA